MMYSQLDYSFRNWETSEFWEEIGQYRKPETLDIIYKNIPGAEPDTQIELKIYKPKSQNPLPVVMNIHGGGFVSGSYENDNNRATNLALGIPAIVISLNYRLAPKYTYRESLEDCYITWNWIYNHAIELGGIPQKMGLHGVSAGGNMCAGLAFYIRDYGGPRISLNALCTPVLGLGATISSEQMRFDGPIVKGEGLADNVRLYAGGLNGGTPSYYAVPNLARDFSGLPPTLVIAAEFDSLRDESTEYVQHLQKDAIPVEYYLMPRAIHGFTAVQCPMTYWIEQGMCYSFLREFSREES